MDVVTGYHGNIREYERVDSTTGQHKVNVEALGDAGMPRFAFNPATGQWVTEYEGKTSTHKRLAEAIAQNGLQMEYYTKTCCITGRCATCAGKCGALARDFNVKNATNRDAESVAYWQREMQYGIEPEFGDLTLADSSDVQYSSRTKKKAARVFFKENVFPPYDESQSDSHEVAERWARSKAGKEEGERLLSHHGRWYVIKAFDDMKYGYQIIEQVSNAEYNRREKQYDNPGRYDSIRRALDKSASYAGRGTPTHKTGSGFDSLSVKYRKEDTAVSRLDQKQVRWGNATLEQASTDRGSGPDRQRRNGPSVKSQIKQLRNEIRDLEDRRDFAYDKIEKRSIQEEIDEREYRIRQLLEESKIQPQMSDRSNTLTDRVIERNQTMLKKLVDNYDISKGWAKTKHTELTQELNDLLVKKYGVSGRHKQLIDALYAAEDKLGDARLDGADEATIKQIEKELAAAEKALDDFYTKYLAPYDDFLLDDDPQFSDRLTAPSNREILATALQGTARNARSQFLLYISSKISVSTVDYIYLLFCHHML